MAQQNSGDLLVYVGTYTRGKSEGIYVYRMDASTGALTPLSKATGLKDPSFLTLHPQGGALYAVNELGEQDGKFAGGVCAFAIDPKTGALSPLNQQPSHGAAPCHLVVDATGKWLVLANYTSGSTCVYPVQRDGRLGEVSHFVQHEGSSIAPRQKGPHAHSVTIDAANRYVFVADLGLDKILIYRLDLSQGRLLPNEQPWVRTHPGAGPRHFDFHPSGRYAYGINELDSTMTAFTYDAGRGGLTEIQSLSTLPEGFSGVTHCADIHVHPSGKFVYGSNRGHDSIAIFAIDEQGRLTAVGHEPTQGKIPRNFGLDPTGTFLLAANQDSDTIVTFRIDPQTGRLKATGHVAEVPAPVCVKFHRVAS
ncbi:MAG: lactonase family protein [Candidatus Latescibacteria bacterium]|nr:lactonase family protein [Candidatus Latescibacterota bacterium]